MCDTARRCVYLGTHVEVRRQLPGVALWLTEADHSLSSQERQKGTFPHRSISPAPRVPFLCSPPCIGCLFPYRAIFTAARLHLGPLLRISLLRCDVACVCTCSLAVYPLLKNVTQVLAYLKTEIFGFLLSSSFSPWYVLRVAPFKWTNCKDFLP